METDKNIYSSIIEKFDFIDKVKYYLFASKKNYSNKKHDGELLEIDYNNFNKYLASKELWYHKRYSKYYPKKEFNYYASPLYVNRIIINKERKDRFSLKNYESLIREGIIDDNKMKKEYISEYSHLYIKKKEQRIEQINNVYGRCDNYLSGDEVFNINRKLNRKSRREQYKKMMKNLKEHNKRH